MTCLRALLVATLAALLPPHPALAFRNVPVDAPVPVLSLAGADGRGVAVPVPGRVTLVFFWRPGQVFSDDALADLIALAPTLGKRGVAVVALAEAGARGPAPLPFQAVTDGERRASAAFGVIVFPSTAVVDARGVLRAYIPSRNSSYRTLVESHTLHALGELSDAELAARLARAGEVYGQSAEAAQAAYKRGVALAAERRPEDATREFARALALRPDFPEAHLGLGYARLDANDAVRALEQFESVLARNPTSPSARVGVGIARIRLGRTDEGIRLLEEAIVLNPEPVRGHYELGRAYEARGDVERAVSHYRWALQKLLQGRK